ncbi:MAG: hypothetical protein JNL39_01905 [Opitutaceae bacterium]|nr:hypothetical protein [Opitutaceae bacterium]
MLAALLARVFFWLWFACALAAGHLLLLQRVPAATLPALAAALAAFLALIALRIGVVRTWVNALDLRLLVLVHLTRFTGLYFLDLGSEGVLGRSFAVPTGIVDLVVATMALPLVFAPLEESARRRATTIWNIVGLAGLLFALGSALRLSFTEPVQLRMMTILPLSLWPTFLAPLLLGSHIAIFARLAGDRSVAE